MAYFANGTDGSLYEAQYCDQCAHRRNPDTGERCSILMLHLLWNGDQIEDRELALDLFIPREGVTNTQCSMYIERTQRKKDNDGKG